MTKNDEYDENRRRMIASFCTIKSVSKDKEESVNNQLLIHKQNKITIY